MYAVIRTGGKQYTVREGQAVRVEKLDGEAGATVNFDEVLMLGGDQVHVGSPLVSGASVTAEITRQGKASRIKVFKMKRRKNYRRTRGHRQPFTEVRIQSIQGGK